MIVAPRFTILFQLAHVGHSFLGRTLISLPSKGPTPRCLSLATDHEQRDNKTALSHQMKEAYSKKQTDGIIDLHIHDLRYEPTEIWDAVVEASQKKQGVAASIVNALIASCPSANDALDLYDISCCRPDAPFQIRPDVITYCLLADLVRLHNGPEAAEVFLDYARRQSEKSTPGGRKERAAARRRHRFASLQEAEDTIRQQVGPEFAVLFENESFAVVNKPSGISCTAQPGKKQAVDLPRAIIQTVGQISSINRALVHRLDKETSGCLIIPKTDMSHASFVRKFFLRKIDKTYMCIVTSAPTIDSGLVHIPVDSRPAESKYDIIHRFENGRAMLQVSTLTGRKHQVRVHCAQGLGSPILGDSIYGDNISSDKPLHLHASSVCFHDANGNRVAVEAPLPVFWPEIDL